MKLSTLGGIVAHMLSPAGVAYRFADGVDKWVQDVHHPMSIPEAPYCWACSVGRRKVHWPCRHYIAATEHRIDRRVAGGEEQR